MLQYTTVATQTYEPPRLISVCSLEEIIERSIWQTVSAHTGSPGSAAYRLSPEPAAPSVSYLPHLEAYRGFYYEKWNDGRTDPDPPVRLNMFLSSSTIASAGGMILYPAAFISAKRCSKMRQPWHQAKGQKLTKETT